MDRESLLSEIEKRVSSPNLIKHMLATEACMERLAEKFNRDTALWGMAGLAHDIDYDATNNNPSAHGIEGAKILKEMGACDILINAVKAHAGKKEPDTLIEWSLYSCDPLTGLIVAATLMHPKKSLNAVDMKFLMKRFSEKRFAAGADRRQIKESINTGLKLEEFIKECLNAMKSIEGELEL